MTTIEVGSVPVTFLNDESNLQMSLTKRTGFLFVWLVPVVAGCAQSEPDRKLEESARAFFDGEMKEWKEGKPTLAQPDAHKGTGLADYKIISFKRIPNGSNFDVMVNARLLSGEQTRRFRYLVIPARPLAKVGDEWELGPPEEQ